jgi:hypothetical protein
MKFYVLLICAFFLTSCSPSKSVSITSPSGVCIVQTEISGNKVRLKFTDTATKNELSFQSRASDLQKWAIDWSPKNTLILYSSDIGTYAYELKDGAVIERLAQDDELEVGRKAYQIKYGKQPRI